MTREDAETMLCNLAPDCPEQVAPILLEANIILLSPVIVLELTNLIKVLDSEPDMDDVSYFMIKHFPKKIS